MADYSELERRYGLPPGILSAVEWQESRGNPAAVSPVGARGPFQFMPKTAAQYGIDPHNPEQSAQAAAKFLSSLNQKYEGDIPRVLAGYNWGQGNVDRQGMANAPAETRDYIEKVSGMLQGRDFSSELFGASPAAEEAGRDFSAELFGAPLSPAQPPAAPASASSPTYEKAPLLAQVGRGMTETYQGIKQGAMKGGAALGLVDPAKAAAYDQQIKDEAALYERNNPDFQIARLLGNVAAVPVPGPVGGVGAAARVGQTALSGAAAAALQPVLGPGDYDTEKAKQILTGGIAAPVIGELGRKVVQGVGKIAGMVAGKVRPEVQETLKLAAKHNVPLHYSDVTGDKFARRAENVLEYAPVVGTAGAREAQQVSAKAAAEKVSGQLYDDMISTSFKGLKQVEQAAAAGRKGARELAREIANSGDDWNRIIQTSGNLNLFRRKLIAEKLYDDVAKKAAGTGWVNTSGTEATIAQEMARLEKSVVPDPGSIQLLAKIQDRLNDPAVDVSFNGIRRLHSDLGDMVRDFYKGTGTMTGSKGVEVIERVRNAVDADMRNFATTSGNDDLIKAWKRADSFFREKVVPFKDPALAKALKDAPADEVFAKYIQAGGGGGRDRADNFFRALDPRGQAAVRYGMVTRALDNAVDESHGFQPGKYAGELEKLSKARGVVFKGQGKQELDGFAKLMRHAELAGNQRQFTPLTQQFIGMGTAAAASFAGVPGTQVAGGVLAGARLLYTTEAGKKYLYAANMLKPGTSAMADLVERINAELARAGATAGGAEQGQPGRILP